MAPSPKHLFFFFLIFLISSSLIQARESQFFSKFTPDKNITIAPTTTTTLTNTNNNATTTINNNNNNNATTTTINNNNNATTTINNNNAKETEFPEENVPSGDQAEEPSFTPQTGNGYGLYDHSSSQYPSTTTTSNNNAYDTYANLPDQTSTEEYSGGSYEYKELNTGYNNNNWSKTKQQGMSDTRFSPEINNPNNIDNGHDIDYKAASGNREGIETSEGEDSTNKYNYNNWSKTKQQGMSDTRFLEKGKYSYNANNENYYHGKESQPASGSHEGFGTSEGADSMNKYNYGSYYGNNDNAYEFNNSMEDLQSQEENQESQGGYIP